METTGDETLHQAMADITAKNIAELLEMDEASNIFDHFSLKVLKSHVKHVEKEIPAELRAKIAKLENELQLTRNAAMRARARASTRHT